MSAPINTYYQLRMAVEAGIIPQEKAVAVVTAGGPHAYHNPLEPEESRVWSPFFNVDPGSGSQPTPGQKVFPPGEINAANGKAEAEREGLRAALAWASTQYGITAWARNRLDEYVPAEVDDALPLVRMPGGPRRRG